MAAKSPNDFLFDWVLRPYLYKRGRSMLLVGVMGSQQGGSLAARKLVLFNLLVRWDPNKEAVWQPGN